MIRKYVYGDPFRTGAVVKNIVSESHNCPLDRNVGKEPLAFRIQMKDHDIIYGLGENVRGINKRGWVYVSNCTDETHHFETKRSLYSAHNFLVWKGDQILGIFIDYPGKVTFDVGYGKSDELAIIPEDENLAIYLIDGESVMDVVRQFRQLIGRSYIPPLWAFGYGQSRWGYRTAEDIREVVKNYREKQIPLDSVYLDIDYMDEYKDFTVNRETFPDFPEFVQEMKEKGIHLVPIIDAGVKIEKGYQVYEEGVEKGYFCKDEEGKDFVGAVWPGRVHFPDFLNSQVREWFGNFYKKLLDQGIDGFWNDMNEPTIFYSDRHMKEVLEGLERIKWIYQEKKNMDLHDWFSFKELFGGISNNPEDYRSFYHQVDGEKVRHDKVHNLYGYNMTKAAGEAFDRLEPDKRILLFSRSSYIGMHRYGGTWTGDNHSWWSHLLMNIQMMPSLNMCGFLYTGADLGGFSDDITEDLLKRWLAFGVFTPLMRNHSALGTRPQESYRFDDSDKVRQIVNIRYRLLPYLYSEFMKAALEDGMYFKPLAWEYPEDEMAAEVEDQLLVGESLMVAPVYVQNATGRNVYLPESMKMLTFGQGEDLEGIVLEKGWHYVKVPIDSVVCFLRPDRILPLSTGGQNVDEVDFENLNLISYVRNGAEYRYYTDDGIGKMYEEIGHIRMLRVGK